MIFPPCSLKAVRSGLVAFSIGAILLSAAWTSRSTLNVWKSQAALLYNMVAKNCVPKAYCRLLPGAGPVTHNAQPPPPVSPPGGKPGITCWPLDVFGPAYIFFNAATCGPVRQL